MQESKYVYPHGLPFSEKLGVNLKDQDTRVEKKKASLIIVDGGVGEGKTTLLIHIMDYVNKLHDKPEVKLEFKKHSQLSMGGSEFTKNFRICYELKIIIAAYDEAGDFNKRGSISRFNAMINRIFETFRGFKIIVVLAMPNFNVLDNNIFDNNIPRLLLHLKNRNEKYGNFFGYSLVAMNWIRYWHDKLPKGSKYKCYNKVQPNFVGHFLDLPPERNKKLDKISTKGKLSILRKTEIQIEGLMSYKDLASKIGRSVIWVRQRVSELKIKHKRKINQAKYFDDNALNRLVDWIDEYSNRR